MHVMVAHASPTSCLLTGARRCCNCCCWCYNQPNRRWVPVAERSRSLSLVYSGMFIGSILGLALSPAMIAALGWPSVFYVFGSLGVLWYTAWNNRAASTPADDPRISKAEKVRSGGRSEGQEEVWCSWLGRLGVAAARVGRIGGK
jgi:MFS family permease